MHRKNNRFPATDAPGQSDSVESFHSLDSVSNQPVESSSPIRLLGHILLADDCSLSQRLYSTFLKKAGATVDIAENGEIAVQKISKTLNRSNKIGPSQAFDLVLIDMQMPVVDGCSATKTLRAQGFTGPIVVLTANSKQADREKCLRAGCDEFLTKPIERAQLLAACRDWISSEERRSDSRTRPDMDRESSEVLDQDALHRLIKGDMELLSEIVSLFHEDTSQLLKQAEAAVQESKPEIVVEIAHRLKGVCGAIHAESAFQAARRLEELGREQDLDLIELHLVRLVQEIDRVIPRLDEMNSRQPSDDGSGQPHD